MRTSWPAYRFSRVLVVMMSLVLGGFVVPERSYFFLLIFNRTSEELFFAVHSIQVFITRGPTGSDAIISLIDGWCQARGVTRQSSKLHVTECLPYRVELHRGEEFDMAMSETDWIRKIYRITCAWAPHLI